MMSGTLAPGESKVYTYDLKAPNAAKINDTTSDILTLKRQIRDSDSNRDELVQRTNILWSYKIDLWSRLYDESDHTK